jgi:hypothetical protein
MSQSLYKDFQLVVPNSDRALLRWSVGSAFLTVLLSVGFEQRLHWLIACGIVCLFFGPMSLLLAVWEICRYGNKWRAATAAMLSATASLIAWGTIAQIITGYLW